MSPGGRNSILSLFILSKRFYSDVRVRFAPSPTGLLHLGGLRTALYNYLFARSQNGKFIVRIEDTDRSRLISGATQQLLDDLSWAGLVVDEGPDQIGDFGPYVQSQRKDLYRREVDKLIKSDSAYYCFCTERRLDLLRKDALRNRQVPKYDNYCRSLPKHEVQSQLDSGVEKCVRFKLSKAEHFEDLVYGKVLHQVEDIEGDPVILKSDGWPTYHLANVVDDHHMAISHVIRGVEWIQSTNKHLMIYNALDYTPPRFAHLPLLLNSDGSKLSKRQGDLSVKHLRDSGILPRALINFVASAGTGFTSKPSTNSSLDELIAKFSINHVTTASSRLPMSKLNYFNQKELIRKAENDEITELVSELKRHLMSTLKDNQDNLETDDVHVKNILTWSLPRISRVQDLVADNLKFLWIKPSTAALDGIDPNVLQNLEAELSSQEFADAKELNEFFRKFSHEHQIPFADLMKLSRKVLSGLQRGPSVAEMLLILGKPTSLERLRRARHAVQKG